LDIERDLGFRRFSPSMMQIHGCPDCDPLHAMGVLVIGGRFEALL
jgi:hypothetical protein